MKADPSRLDSLTKLLQLHIVARHTEGENQPHEGMARGQSKAERARKEFQKATSLRTIIKCTDDAVHNLCEARNFTFPTNLKSLAQNMPIVAQPINPLIDLTPMGLHVADPELLRKLHDRGTTALRLKEFIPSNLKSLNSGIGEMVPVQARLDDKHMTLGRKLEDIDSSQGALIAVFNYATIRRFISPCDLSHMAFFRVCLELYLAGPPTVKQFSQFFDKFVHQNSIRAQTKEVPMKYEEIMTLWTTHNGPQGASMLTSNIQKIVDKTIDQKVQDLNLPKGGSPLKRARKSVTFCRNWNETKAAPFCSNTAATGGCLDKDGNFLKHGCSKKVGRGIFCNSSLHGFHGH